MEGKTLKLIVLVGILVGMGLYFVAPVLGDQFRYKTIKEKETISISEESNNTIRKAYNYSFSLAKNEKVIIEFGVHYLNSTVTMLIMGQGQYDSYLAANTTSASITAGRYYFITTPNPFSNPVTSYTNGGSFAQASTLTNDDSIYTEFMGDGSSTNIWSEPGSYQIVVYGKNPSNYVDDVNFSFDLKVQKTGAGKAVETVFSTMGLLILIATGVFALVFLIKSQEGGN
jgi:hypothetical protein